MCCLGWNRKERYGKANEHNGHVARDRWLLDGRRSQPAAPRRDHAERRRVEHRGSDLAVDLAVRLVAERGVPISAALHDLLVELLAATQWADRHDDDLAVLARLRR